MTGNVQPIKPEAPPARTGFVETPSAKAMLIALRRARARSRLTMIAGAPGVGKTETLWTFKNEAPDAIITTTICQEGGAWNLCRSLCKILDLPANPNPRDMPGTRAIIAEAIGESGFVVVDEAQHLVQANPRGPDNWGALEWARGLAEGGMFGLAFVGDMKLLNGLNDAPQLRRRTHPRVVLPHASEEDVAAFCRARGVTDAKTIYKLARVAKRFGGLGDVSEALITAREMTGGATPSLDDIGAALEFLELEKGGLK